MSVSVRAYQSSDREDVRKIWNHVVEEADAFPQEKGFSPEEADAFFPGQTYTGVAVDDATGEIVGMYILHPNNVGRCGHLCNTSYAVKSGKRGQHIGELLVKDSLKMAKQKGFRILQFNAVVAGNTAARKLYQKLGFVELGTVPGGFRKKDGSYEDIVLEYHVL